jgi:lysozyme
MYILGCDVSRWQDDNSTPQMMDFEKSKAEGIKFAIMKTSQSTWLDEDYIMNWNNCKLAGIPRAGYHFLDWTKPAIDQARFFAGVLEKDPGEKEPVLDYECRTGVPERSKAIDEAFIFVNELENLLGIKPVIYTSPGFWNEFGSQSVYWKEYKLWIANYEVYEPKIPKPWDKWYMWQYTDKGDGIKYGAESFGLDLNYFNNIDYDFSEGIEITDPPVVIDPPVIDSDKIITTSYLNIRTQPIINNSTRIGTVAPNTEFEIVGKDGNDWLKGVCYLYKEYTKEV